MNESSSRSGVPTAEARHELEQDLLGLPELYAGQVDSLDIGRREETPTRDATGHDRVGIVFVHGVGSQRKGDTLREFATPLVDWLEEWHRDRASEPEMAGEFRVTWSELTPSGNEPAAAGVVIPPWTDRATGHAHAGQVWVLTEAWWASRVEPPPLGTMVSWAAKRLGRLISGLLAGAVSAASRPLYRSGWQGDLERFFQAANAILISVIYAFAQILLFGLLLILSVAASIPIPALDRLIFVRLARPLLTDNVGDFYVCMYDRLQAVNVRQSVYQAVNWLVRTKECSRVVVVAHSGGTVVATDALGTKDLLGLGGQGPLWKQIEQVTTLITFGAALNAAWEESKASDQGKPAREIPERLHGSTTWLNFWTHFDWALPGRGLDRGPAATVEKRFSFPVTNGLSPLRDHGGYFSNFEEFISRLAQEADSPSSKARGEEYTHSRFWPGYVEDADRVWKRYARVSMMTWWRFAAIMAAPAMFFARYAVVGHDAGSDAAMLWRLLPSMGTGLGTVVPGALSLSLVLVIGIAVAAAYAIWLAAFFAGWNERMSRYSARRDPPAQTYDMARRTAGFVAFLVLITVTFALIPPFADLVAALGRVLG